MKNLEATLVRYYGQGVRVEFVDIFGEAMEQHAEANRLILERGVPLPLVTVNGKPKFAGGMPLDGISAEVEALGVLPVDDEGA